MTSAAVTGLPSVNLASCRNVTTQVVGSVFFHEVASPAMDLKVDVLVHQLIEDVGRDLLVVAGARELRIDRQRLGRAADDEIGGGRRAYHAGPADGGGGQCECYAFHAHPLPLVRLR